MINKKNYHTANVVRNVLVTLAALYLFSPGLVSMYRDADPTGERELALFPTMTNEQVEAEFKRLEASAPREPNDPQQLYSWWNDVSRVSRIAELKVKANHEQSREISHVAPRLKELADSTARPYIDKFSNSPVMNQGRVLHQNYLDRMPAVPKNFPRKQLLWAHFIMGLVMVFVGMDKARQRDSAQSPWQLAILFFTWEATIWKFPFRITRREVGEALHFAATLLGVIMTLGSGGAAFAQAVSKVVKKKKSKSHVTVVVDSKATVFAGEGLETATRLTVLNTRKGIGFENVFGTKELPTTFSMSENLTALARVVKTKTLTIFAAPGWRYSASSRKGVPGHNAFNSAVLGGEIFYNRNRVSVSTPVLSFRIPIRAPDKPVTFALSTKVLYRIAGRLLVGGEMNLSKPLRKPSSWSRGIVAEWKQSPNWRFAAGLFRDNLHHTGIRGEVIFAR